MALQLSDYLAKIVSPNQQDQDAARVYFENAKQRNYAEFVKVLSEVLKSESAAHVRQAAGLQLKNALDSKDAAVKQQLHLQWLALPAELRQEIKENIVHTLGTEGVGSSTAAQCIASIACAELPVGQWNEIIEVLMRNVTSGESTESLKQASLQSIGYICSDVESIQTSLSNSILTAIVHGMRKQETSDSVRLAATQALNNSLEFAHANFERANERHLIMQVVCEATQAQNQHIRVAALECLVKIMSIYYQYMEDYMGAALFAITVDAMKSQDEQVAMQGIEFWSNVCDEEIQLADELEQAEIDARTPVRFSRHYAKGALQYLVPILTEKMTQQDENEDEDEWTVSKAASVCLGLLAGCCGDDIAQYTLPFITQNIRSQDWHFREAAVMAFGQILEGPDVEKLKPMIIEALPFLINLLQDDNIVVRDSTGWVIGQICSVAAETVISQEVLQLLLPAMSRALQQEPRVAQNICWAIGNLAQAAYESAKDSGHIDATGEVETYILSSCFEAMVTELLKTTERPDASANLRTSAYEALMELIKNSPKDCYECVQKAMIEVLERLKRLQSMMGQIQTASDRSQFFEIESMLCAALNNVMRKMSDDDAEKIADAAMQALLVCIYHGGKSSVQSDAILAISAVSDKLKEKFLKYMDVFKPILTSVLQNHAEVEVCSAAVGLVEDLASNLGDKITPYGEEFLQHLVSILMDNSVDKSVKPQVLGVFGSMALAMGSKFKMYLPFVFETLGNACSVQVDNNDQDEVDFLNDLRESCLDAYIGIVQSFRDENTNQVIDIDLASLQPHLERMMQLLVTIGQDNHQSERVLASAAGLVGDLVTTFKKLVPNITTMFETEGIQKLLEKAKRNKSQKCRTMANYAMKEIKKARPNEITIAS